MKLGIDCLPFFSVSRYRGIGMYARELVRALQADGRAECHFLNIYGDYDGQPEPDGHGYLHNYYAGPPDRSGMPLLWDESTAAVIKAQAEHYLSTSGVEALLFTSPMEQGGLLRPEWFGGVFTAAILYDLIPLIFPERYLSTPEEREAYERSLDFLRGMDLLLAISQSAKEDAVRLLGIPPEKIAVIYAGLSPVFCKKNVDGRALRKKYGIEGDFLMFAGGGDFRKNIEGIIRAYSKLEKKLMRRCQFVIAGQIDEGLQEHFRVTARDCGVEDRVVMTGFIPEEDIAALYNETELLVFPSIYEGFGLPVIEAMACGAPVVTSDTSSLGEVARGYAALVDPTSVRAITGAVRGVLTQPAEARALAAKAEPYARAFTWEKSARAALDALEQALPAPCAQAATPAGLDVSDDLLRAIAVRLARQSPRPGAEQLLRAGRELDRLARGEREAVLPCKRILYDLTAVQGALQAGHISGIGRVALKLFHALKAYGAPTAVVADCDEKGALRLQKVDMTDCALTGQIVRPRQGDLYLMADMRMRGVNVERRYPGVGALRALGVRCCAILYDLLPIQMPECFQPSVANEFGGYVRELVQDYDGIFSDSRTVSDELVQYCHEQKLTPDHTVRTGWFHLGVDSFPAARGRMPYNVETFCRGDVYLMVGTIEPRKGHATVLEAFERLWAGGGRQKLCVIGREGWKTEELMARLRAHPERGKRLELFEGAGDDVVRHFYEHSAALIQASLGEGFGLPLIEAGCFGLPVICSDIPVFREVAGEHALYFETASAQSLSEAVARFEALRLAGDAPDSRAIGRATWDDAARRVYRMLALDEGWYSTIPQ